MTRLDDEVADRGVVLGQPDVQSGSDQQNFFKRTWQELSDFCHEKSSSIKAALATVAIAGSLAAGAVAIHEADEPSLKSFDVTESGRGLIEGLETTAPFILGAAGAQLLFMTRNEGRIGLKLAARGLAENHDTLIRRIAAGALLPSLGIGALTTALAIEEGIRTGPIARIHTIEEELEQSGSEETSQTDSVQIIWGLQPGTNHDMNDSTIRPEAVRALTTAVEAQGGLTLPYRRALVTIPTRANSQQQGLLTYVEYDESTPSILTPKVDEGAACDLVDERCILEPHELIVDKDEGLEVGDKVTIRDQEFTVVGLAQDSQSFLNRLAAFTAAPESMQQEDYYGVVSVVRSKEEIQELIDNLGLASEIDPQTLDEYFNHTMDSWAENGTPLVVIMLANLDIFAGGAIIAISRFQQERTKSVRGTLRAIGQSRFQSTEYMVAQSTLHTAKGILPGALVTNTAIQFMNGALPGYQTDLRPGMLLAATSSTLALSLFTVPLALRKQSKQPLIDQMKVK